jgi:hypothetical protein
VKVETGSRAGVGGGKLKALGPVVDEGDGADVVVRVEAATRCGAGAAGAEGVAVRVCGWRAVAD